MPADTSLIITAGGTSQRFGEDKLFYLIHGQPLILHTLNCFLDVDFKEVVLTIHEKNRARIAALLEPIQLPWPLTLVEGGSSRMLSVQKGFVQLDNCDVVLIHDGARPNLSEGLLQRLLDTTSKHVVIPVVPLQDTIKMVTKNQVKKTVDRQRLVRVQTPQKFPYHRLEEAYKFSLNASVNDESELIEILGHPVYTVGGEKSNIKVTDRDDIAFVKTTLPTQLVFSLKTGVNT